MQVLVVAATEAEVAPLVRELQETKYNSKIAADDTDCQILSASCHLLTTGVGMVATAFALGKHLATHRYDLALNLGIAGSFDHGISLGEVLEVTRDTFAELGAEDDVIFIPLEELGFGEATCRPSANLASFPGTVRLQKASAITVNTVHGNQASIQQVTTRLQPQLESMEGAAFFYACNDVGVPCMQIRTVSNYVEKRNRDNWQIGSAIKNLNTFAIEFLKLIA